jgi:hypothetical protein
MPSINLEQLAATRAQLDAVCDLLLSPTPQTLDRCSTILETASRQMSECKAQIGSVQGNAVAIEAAAKLRRSFQRARALLETAGRFHFNWLAIRGALTGGYTDRGEPAPVRHAGRISLEA